MAASFGLMLNPFLTLLSWVRGMTQNRGQVILLILLLGSSTELSNPRSEAQASEINPRFTPQRKLEPLRSNPPTQLRLTPQTDSGSSNRDNITTQAQPTLTGVATPGSTIQLYGLGKRLGTTTSVNGIWRFQMPTALADGQYTIGATATTALGESRPTYLLIVIDRTKPTAQLQTLIDQQFLPLVTNQAIAGGTRLVGVLDGTGSPIQQLTYQLTPSSAAVPIPVSKAGLINQVLTVGRLAPGQHQLRFTAIDVAGNQQTFGPFQVSASAKTTAIEPSQVMVRLLEDSGRDATDGLTNRADMVGFIIGSKKLLRLQARLQPLSASGLATTAQLESLLYQDITHLVESNGTFWLKPEQLNSFDRTSLPEGRYTLHVRGEFADNASVSQQLSWMLDQTEPELVLSNIDGIAWFWNERLLGTVQEVTGEVTVRYGLTRIVDRRPVSRGQFTVSQVVNVLLPELIRSRQLIEEDMPYELTMTALDRAGNQSSLMYRFFIPNDRPVVDDDPWQPKKPSNAP